MTAGSRTSSRRLFLSARKPYDADRGYISRDDHACGRSSVGRLQKADEEGPTGGPASLRLKVSEDPGARVTTVFRSSQETDDDGDQPCHCPEDSESLFARTKLRVNFFSAREPISRKKSSPQARAAICFQRQKWRV